MHITLPIKYRILIFISGITVLLLLIIVFVIIPAIQQILELENNINTMQEELEEKYIKTQKLRRSVMELDKIKQISQVFTQTTITKGDELKVITELEEIAAGHNIEQTLNIALIETALPHYRFSFLNKGFFTDHINYLKALEKLPYYIIIDSMQWEKGKGDAGADTVLTLRFDSIIYVDSS